MVKRLPMLLSAVAALCAGTYQTANMWAAQGIAVPGSLVALLPHDGGKQATMLLSHMVPQAYEQRFLATIAVTSLEARPDTATIAQIQAQVDALPDTPSDNALRARLAVLRGDRTRAFDMALSAGEMHIVNTQIAYAAEQHHSARAIALEHRVIAMFSGQRTQRETLADAYWHLGVLENLAATAGTAPMLHRIRARDAFEANVQLTPLSGRALLSAGYAELALGNTLHANRSFADALAGDPASADALVGLAQIALLQRDTHTAATYSARASALAPMRRDVQHLKAELGSRGSQ